MTNPTRCGFVALIGRANVGKSSIFNRLVGESLSLVNRKAQTTRHYIRGIMHVNSTQVIFVDSPGLDTRNKKFRFNKCINNAFAQLLPDVDFIVLVLDRNRLNDADRQIIKTLNESGRSIPFLVLINKVDLLNNTTAMLPFVVELKAMLQQEPVAIIPVSAKLNKGIDSVMPIIETNMPSSTWLYAQDMLTDAPQRFFIAEIIRGQLLQQLNEELPYASTVVIEKCENKNSMYAIGAVIIVDSKEHKQIVIGAGGKKIKSIGTSARLNLQNYLHSKVDLRLWVKVVKSWRNAESSELHNLTPS